MNKNKKGLINFIENEYKNDLIYEEDLINYECDLVDYISIVANKYFKKGGYYYDDYEDDEF